MAATFSFEVVGERLEIKFNRSLHYSPTQFIIRAKSGEVVIEATDAQLTEIEYALREHLDNIHYPDKKQEGIVCRRL